MEDRGRLGLVLIGLLLLLGAVGYYVYNQRVNLMSHRAANLPPIKIITPAKLSPSPSALIVVNSSPIPSSSPATLGIETKGGQLPKTGAPEVLLAAYSVSALIAGWSLRKFPN